MLIRVIDFETTGLPPDASVCEVGWCDVTVTDGVASVGDIESVLVNPGRPMPIEAMAVHHIRDADVADAPSPDATFLKLMDGADAFAAHNAAFEQAFFKGGETPWICTYRCGIRAWPDSPSHSNQALRYFLGLDLDERAMPPHRAGPDAYVTARVLCELLAAHASAKLIKCSAEPALLVKCGFGKHRGAKWSEVPTDYLDWLLRQKDMGEDIHFTARHHLRLRASKEAHQ
jgi:exodeoxyribonuclease X